MATKLKTTDEQFNGLHEALDKVRKTSKTVTVDKQALSNLLMDHSTIAKELKL